MKRILALILLVATVLSFSACQSVPATQTAPPTQTQTQTGAPTQTTGKTDENVKLPNVPQPISWDTINALPIANSSMSQEELRQLCLDFFRLQQTFQWTPNETMTYTIASYGIPNTFNKGTLYQGLPYVTDATGNLYIAMDYYNSETGVLDVASKGGNALAEIIGNQCSFGSSWGWARACNTLTSTYTNTINEAHGWIKLGNYEYLTNESDKLETTKVSCMNNGEQVMYQAYALFQPADGMVTYNSAGHVRMVSSKATVVKKANGTIDGKKSFVYYVDQGSSLENSVLPDGTVAQIQGDVDVKVSFSDLYKDGYLPFTVAELCGKNPVEKATATINYDAATTTVKALSETSLVSNYPISDVRLILTDAEGNTIYSYVGYPKYVNTFTLGMKTVILPTVINRYLKQNDLSVSILARVGTGEQITVYTGMMVSE